MKLFFSLELEYTKNKELNKEDVIALQMWTDAQPHLPKLSEWEAILFLHCRFYNFEAAKETIEKYFRIRSSLNGILHHRNFDNAIKALDVFLVADLPLQSPEGYRVLFVKYMDPNPSKYVFNDAIMTFDMICNIIQAYDGPQLGYIIVTDALGQSFRHLIKVNLFIARKVIEYIQEAIPARLQAFHIINTSSIIQKMINIFLPLFDSKFHHLLHVHASLEDLYKVVHKIFFQKITAEIHHTLKN